ncbi:MAG: FtsL-like putative cell division protein [Bacteroidetes bacterium]|nr:FtsL-like putative cell division protein [Bacteroidota bacterium]MDA0937342.1 FtsL-like putative cell division protein [Bacteroidota bacterium]MDA1344790.1 FtsL-like putative cell division protein [Bacteroidota bacterium]
MKKIISLLNIEFLVNEGALKNWRMIFFLSTLALIMIGSGHSADGKIFRIAQLNDEIKYLKSRFIEGRSQLMDRKMESKIVTQLRDRGVKPATQPPVKIVVK